MFCGSAEIGSKVHLFVYGTLMKSGHMGSSYLDDEEFIGKYVLKGYDLYDIGHFPGIVKGEGRVKGELYRVTLNKLTDIDRYEGEGSLYRRKMVQVQNENKENINAFVYVYNKSVTGKDKIDYKFQPWHRAYHMKKNNKKYVWYVCYGSNINSERFMRYINSCSDKTPPIDEKPIILNYPIYFSNHSRRWDNKGVTFLNAQQKGKSYGKGYLITEEQFDEINILEGPTWYNSVIELGSIDGIAMKTFTHNPKYIGLVAPSVTYLDIIRAGLMKTYPKMSRIDINTYLSDACLR